MAPHEALSPRSTFLLPAAPAALSSAPTFTRGSDGRALIFFLDKIPENNHGEKRDARLTLDSARKRSNGLTPRNAPGRAPPDSQPELAVPGGSPRRRPGTAAGDATWETGTEKTPRPFQRDLQ